MRAFVFLLILANLLFLAWTHGYLGQPADPDAFRMQQQLLAERIKVVARGEPPADTAKPVQPAPAEEKAAADAKPVDACLQLVDLPLAESVRIESLLSETWPAFKPQRTAAHDGGTGYWVYIPPLANKQEADSKAAELKRLRVPELFVVQENGPYNRAISLGLFSTKDKATARLDALRSLGVKSAKVGERNPATVLLEIHGPQTQADALRKALVETLQEGQVTACKPTAAQ